MTRVAVIGAGASGLASIKTCLEEGLEPVCYEKTSHLGGVWYYSDDDPRSDPRGPGAVYHGLHTNVSKEMMAYSDFPMSKSLPPFPRGREMYDYYARYADHFGLLKHINFNVEVVSINQTDDYDDTGRWKVTVRPISGEMRSEVFDAVMVCSGLFPAGYMPDYPGLDSFKGQIMHSCQLKRGSYFTDKTVLVVGAGISAGDTACFISHHTHQVYLSLRSGAWCVPRFFYNHQSFSDYTQQRWKRWIPSRLLGNWLQNKLDHDIDWNNVGLQRFCHPLNVHFMINDILPARIMDGEVRVRSGIERFEASSVHFVDGSVIDNIDCVIFATGYELKFPFFSEEVIPDGYNEMELYQYIFPPRFRHHTLSLLGLCEPLGTGQNVVSEMQARYVAKIFKGELKLPGMTQMQQEITTNKDALFGKYGTYFPFILDPTGYRDRLAEAIGALPSLTKLILTDPVLAYYFYFGPSYPPSHRLVGPGATPGARQALIDCKQDQVHGITLTTVRKDAREDLQVYKDSQRSCNPLFVIIGAILLLLVYILYGMLWI